MKANEIESLIESGKLKYHHTARCAGYEPVVKAGDYHRCEPYVGRFGNGYIIHVPSLRSCRVSRKYHDIIYYIYA